MEKMLTTRIYILSLQMQNQNPFLDESEDEELLQQHSLSSDQSLLDSPEFEEKSYNDETLDLSEEPKDQQSIQPSPQRLLKANENSIKKEDLAAIDKLKMDADWLYENLKR